MAEVRIVAEPRTEFGKGGARRTRRAGKVPAVLYGHGAEVRHLSLDARELTHAFKRAGGANVLLSLDMEGDTALALPRQVQRDPLRGDFVHVDLLAVKHGEKVAVEVALVFVGEAPAVRLFGGVLDTPLNSLSVEAEATAIPTGIEVDLSGLTEVGAHGVTAGSVKLPAGVTLLTDPQAIVAHVMAPAAVVEEEAPVVAVEGEEATEAPVAEEGAAAAE